MEYNKLMATRLNSIRGAVRTAALALQAMPNDGDIYDEYCRIAGELYGIDDKLLSLVKKLGKQVK